MGKGFNALDNECVAVGAVTHYICTVPGCDFNTTNYKIFKRHNKRCRNEHGLCAYCAKEIKSKKKYSYCWNCHLLLKKKFK